MTGTPHPASSVTAAIRFLGPLRRDGRSTTACTGPTSSTPAESVSDPRWGSWFTASRARTLFPRSPAQPRPGPPSYAAAHSPHATSPNSERVTLIARSRDFFDALTIDASISPLITSRDPGPRRRVVHLVRPQQPTLRTGINALIPLLQELDPILPTIRTPATGTRPNRHRNRSCHHSSASLQRYSPRCLTTMLHRRADGGLPLVGIYAGQRKSASRTRATWPANSASGSVNESPYWLKKTRG